MFKLIRRIILIGIVASIAYLAYYFYSKGDAVYPTFVKMENVKVAHVSLFPPVITIKATSVMHNANPVGITLSRIDLDLYLNGLKSGHIAEQRKITIQPESDFEIPILLKIPLKKNPAIKNINDILNPIRDKKEIPYKLSGKLFFEILGTEAGIPFEYEDVMPVSN